MAAPGLVIHADVYSYGPRTLGKKAPVDRFVKCVHGNDGRGLERQHLRQGVGVPQDILGQTSPARRYQGDGHLVANYRCLGFHPDFKDQRRGLVRRRVSWRGSHVRRRRRRWRGNGCGGCSRLKGR